MSQNNIVSRQIQKFNYLTEKYFQIYLSRLPFKSVRFEHSGYIATAEAENHIGKIVIRYAPPEYIVEIFVVELSTNQTWDLVDLIQINQVRDWLELNKKDDSIADRLEKDMEHAFRFIADCIIPEKYFGWLSQ